MMRDEIDFLDADYENVSLGKKPRQIRTKSSSFSKIKESWNNFRIRLLNAKLEKEKNKAVTEGYSEVFTKKDEERMMKRASTIARLEKKIKILENEEVPVDYIDRRAIKIKNAMMKNISFASGNIYSVGLENKDEVFANTEVEEVPVVEPVVEVPTVELETKNVQEEIAEDVRKIMAEEEKREEIVAPEVAGYTPDHITRAEIRAEIDEEFKNVQDVVQEPRVDLEAIKASIDEAFEDVKVDSVPTATIGPGVVEDVISESFDSVDSKISLEDIRTEIDEAMDRVVSKNGNVGAKVDRYNEDGTAREKYTYTPMTDEEIRAAQVNIEYDKYEEIYRTQNAIDFKTAKFEDIFKPADKEIEIEQARDVPIIVPEVDGDRFVNEDTKYDQVDTPSVVSKPTSIEEFSELKAKVVALKKKLAESESKKNTAIRFAERTSTRANEVKLATIEVEKEYQSRLASLQLLAQTLEENCNLNDTAARAAAIDAECNERFISLQTSKTNEYNDAINQVDLILNSYGEEKEEKAPVRRAA